MCRHHYALSSLAESSSASNPVLDYGNILVHTLKVMLWFLTIMNGIGEKHLLSKVECPCSARHTFMILAAMFAIKFKISQM